MTVAAGVPIIVYDGNDSTTVFPFPYIFYTNSDINVVHRDSVGTETVLVLDTDYTVTGAGTTSGEVTYPISGDPLATGEKIGIEIGLPYQQTPDMSGGYFFSTLNLGEDKQMVLLQQVLSMLNRCALYKMTNTDDPPSLEALVAATIAGSASHADFDNLTFATAGHVNFMENIHYLAFPLVAKGTDCAADTNLFGDFVMPFAGTFLQSDTVRYLYATNTTAGVTGTMTVDIHLNGTTIMTTNKIDIDTTEKDSFTAGTQPDLTTTVFPSGGIVTIDIDAIHTTAAKGLTLYMAVRQT